MNAPVPRPSAVEPDIYDRMTPVGHRHRMARGVEHRWAIGFFTNDHWYRGRAC